MSQHPTPDMPDVDDQIRSTFNAQLQSEQARLANGAVGTTTCAPAPTRRPLGAFALAAVLLAVVVGGIVALRPNDGSGTIDAVETPSTTATTIVSTTSDSDSNGGDSNDGDSNDGDSNEGVAAPSTTFAPPDVEPDFSQSTEGAITTTTTVDSAPVAEPDGYNHANGYAVAEISTGVEDGAIVAIDVETGEIARRFLEWNALESQVSPLELHPDGRSVFYSRQSDDFWLSCSTAQPLIWWLGLRADGVEDLIGPGRSPSVSPDGSELAYLRASGCIADPDNPDWVVAPMDTIVIVDLRSGIERSFTVDDITDQTYTYSAEVLENELGGVFWLDDATIATDGAVYDAGTFATQPVPLGIADLDLSHSGFVSRVHAASPTSILVSRQMGDGFGFFGNLTRIDLASGASTSLGQYDAGGDEDEVPLPSNLVDVDQTGRAIIGFSITDGVVADGQPLAIDPRVVGSITW